VVVDGRIVSLRAVNRALRADFPLSVDELVQEGRIFELRDRSGEIAADGPALSEVRLKAPLVRPPKIWCIGLNYVEHASDLSEKSPEEPASFMRPAFSIVGPGETIHLPSASERVTGEGELAIVIGREARYVEEEKAFDHVAGYMICNDVTERAHQFERQGQWVKGKSADTFCPLGPWLVTRDEVPDPQTLGLRLEVNGERMQNGSTSKMVFGVRHIVSYISQFMTLRPGDVIPTGTPAGVGMGKKPQRWLKPGDVMTLAVDGLGEQRQRCVAWGEAKP